MFRLFVLCCVLLPTVIVSEELREIANQQAGTGTADNFWKCSSLGDQPGCQCFPKAGGEFFQCYPPQNDFGFTASYNVEMSHQASVTINCDTKNVPCNETTQLTESVYLFLQGISTRNIFSLDFKFCPLQFGDLSTFLRGYLNLTNLSIRSCTPIPTLSQSSFHNLPQLSNLNLQNNYIEYLPQNIFENQANLKYLQLDKNNLKFINGEIFRNLTQLQILQLGSNQIADLDYLAFNNLLNLHRLNLQNNLLQNLPSNIIQSMTNLKTLDLSNNMLTSLDENTFQYNLKLDELFLRNNALEVLSDGVFKHNTMLTKLKLESNRKLSTVHRNVFGNLVKLQDLDLSKCNLTSSSLESHSFQNLSQLTKLNLAGNKLSELDPELFKGLTTLTSLDLSSNQLTSIVPNTFSSLLHLDILKLDENRLIKLEGNVFKGMGALTKLYLQGNQLEVITSEAMKALASLKVVNLSKNRLKFDEGLVNPFDGWRQSPLNNNFLLESIDLSRNLIQEFYSDWFHLKSLTSLLLSNNSFSTLASGDLDGFTSNGGLSIDLRDNQIEHLLFQWIHQSKEETGGSFKKNLLLDGNPLVCDCMTYYGVQYMNRTMPGIDHYSWTIQAPTLTCKKPALLAGLKPTLVDPKLFLCKCKENFWPCDCYQRPRDKMILLECQQKNLKVFPNHSSLPSAPGYKVQMNLSSNQINFGTPNIDASDCCAGVVSLDLSYNQMSSTMFDVLGWAQNLRFRFPNLTRLDLSHNKFNNMPSGIVDALNGTENLTYLLSGNPWDCDCSNEDFLNFLRISWKRVEDFNEMTCWNGDSISRSFDNLCSVNLLSKYFSIAMPALALIIVVICILFYRSRRTILAWLYTHKLCLWCVVKEDEDDNDELVYDAFISYSHLDEEFVIKELVLQLENPGPGLPEYRLCLHYRDWVAGEWIPEQIARSVKASKRTIVVLSENFLDSLWGKLEFRTAYQQVLKDKRTRLIVVVKGDLPPKDRMDEELQSYLSLNTYLKWNDPWFWDRLRYALPHKKDRSPPGSRLLSRAVIQHSDPLGKEQNNGVKLNHHLPPLPLLTDREKDKIHVKLPPDIEMSLTPSSASSTVPFFPPSVK